MLTTEKILIITPERLGDTLMCTPAIRYLKQNYPNCVIDAIALSPLSAETLTNNRDIHAVFILPAERWLQRRHYDMGINMHDGPLARRYFNLLHCPVYHLSTIDLNLHQAEQALQFVRQLFGQPHKILARDYQLATTTNDRDFSKRLLTAHGVDWQQDRLIGCQIGCHSIAKGWRKQSHAKVWPLAYFETLGKQLQQLNPHWRLVFVGSRQEQSLGKKLQRRIANSINMINQTTVPQLKALIDQLHVFIAPDSGIMHVACASKTPLIALIGPTAPQRTGPYGTDKPPVILQAATMPDIAVDRVREVVLRYLK